MDKYLKIIGENLRALLHEFNLSQADLGTKIGMDQSVISRLLRCKFPNPTLETLRTITGPFGKDIAWILTEHKKTDADSPELSKQISQEIKKGFHEIKEILEEDLEEISEDLERKALAQLQIYGEWAKWECGEPSKLSDEQINAVENHAKTLFKKKRVKADEIIPRDIVLNISYLDEKKRNELFEFLDIFLNERKQDSSVIPIPIEFLHKLSKLSEKQKSNLFNLWASILDKAIISSASSKKEIS